MKDSDVTKFLQDWSQGDPSAWKSSSPSCSRTCSIAARMFRRESDRHTLQPTALVNEVYLRLMAQRKIHWTNREQFFGVAALLMRRILVDYAKRRGCGKARERRREAALGRSFGARRSSGKRLVPGPGRGPVSTGGARSAPEPVVEMHHLTGLSHEEVGEVLGLSRETSHVILVWAADSAIEPKNVYLEIADPHWPVGLAQPCMWLIP